MRRLLSLAPMVAMVTLLIAASSALAASPEKGTIVTVELDLQASNGLQARLETSDEEMVTLEVGRKGEGVVYEVKGEATESGLKVRFGRLGLIDVGFTPTETLNSTEPSEGCTGAPRTLRKGVFTGTIDFTGERGYTRIEASQAAGSMSVISQWQCPEEPTPFALAARSLFDEQKGEKSASLHAFNPRCGCIFYAGVYFAKGRGRSVFVGMRYERREGMEIVRVISARGGGFALIFDHTAGTATARPPSPFSGRGTFRRVDDGRDLWRGTIRMQFFGTAAISLHGSGARAALYPEYHFD